MKEKHFW